MRLLLLLATLPLLAACNPMDAVEGRSPGKEHVERLALLEAQMAGVMAARETVVVEPVVPVAAQPAPVEVPVEPPCVPVFRVVVCP